MSSKLSVRVATALRPPVCVSKPPIPIWLLNLCGVHITWTNPTYPPNVIDINQGVEVNQDLVDSSLYFWDNPSPGPDQLVRVELWAPGAPTYNALIIHAQDSGGVPHYAEAYFLPSRPVPFSQLVQPLSYDYPDPTTIAGFISPVKK